MGDIIELHNDPRHDREFRRGYLAGAHAVIASIGEGMPEAQRKALEAWAATELTSWSTALDRTDFMPPPPPARDALP
jgi:hypothetical protein